MSDTATNFSGMTLEEIQALDQRHHFHSFTAPSALKGAPPFIVDKADGCYVTGQGIRLLDMMAGLGNVNVGYGRPELAETAQRAMSELSYYHSYSAVSNAPAAALSAKLSEISPEGYNKVFFANSASDAVESALKLVAGYWFKRGRPSKKKIISRYYAYHGSTIAATALSADMAAVDPFGISSADVLKAPAPYWYREGGDLSREDFAREAAAGVEEIIKEEGASSVAAMVLEPIQGTMGAIIPPEGYLAEVERICRKYDVLLIADESTTAMGRTGNWFAQETFGFKADFTIVGQGLSSSYIPISAVLIDDAVAEVLEEGDHMFQHGFANSAHPVAAAVALRNIGLLETEGLVNRVREETGPLFEACLKRLEQQELVGEVRVKGLYAGIELTSDKESRQQFPEELGISNHVSQACLLKGMIVRPCGNSLVVCPPLIISPAEISFASDVLAQALNEVHQAIIAD